MANQPRVFVLTLGPGKCQPNQFAQVIAMKQLILGLTLVGLPLASMAQQQHVCAADEMRQRLIENDPSYLEREALYEAELRELMRNSAVQRDDETVYIIPIVFHVIHAGGAENITDEAIFAEVAQLNADYRKLNPDLGQAVPYYQQIAGDVKVEFRLAQIDPDGNCTNGIDRIYTPETLVGNDGSKYNFWPRTKYMNIWTVKQMGGGAAGYAYYPSALTGVAQIADGVIMLSSDVGVDGNTLTHELGHSFNLAHTWGNNAAGIDGVQGTNNMVEECSDDGVADTPFTKGHKPGYCRKHDITCTAKPYTNTLMTFDNMVTGGGTVDPTTIPAEVDSILGQPVLPVVVSNLSAVGVGTTSLADGKFGFSQWGTGATDEDGPDTLYANMTGSIDLNKYYEFTINPELPFAHRPSTITFDLSRTLNGPRTFAVRASRATSFTGNLVALNSASDPNLKVESPSVFWIKYDVDATITGARVNLASLFPAGDQLNPETPETITVRIYAWNAEEADGGFFVDNIKLAGTYGVMENTENYMEYSYCSRQFTIGQVARMRAAMQSNVGDRRSLWQADNLVATGTNDGYQPSCPPNADFYAQMSTNTVPYTSSACAGASVTFRNNSSGGPADSWSWTFQDGTPSTSSLQNPTVTFSGSGWKTVTLTATNAYGSTTRTNAFAVNISAPESNYTMLQEGFESFDNFDNLWPFHAENYDRNHTYFARFNGAATTGTHCVRLNSGARNQLDLIDPTNDEDIDELVTPTLNLAGQTGVQLSFRFAYSTGAVTLDEATERLEVFRSVNCGETWSLLSTIDGAELLSNGNNTDVPPAQWAQKVIPLTPSSTLTANNRYKFRFTSGPFSNDLFIDDINIATPVGITDVNGNAVFMNLFPNPTNDHFTLQVTGMATERTEVIITDIRGAEVYRNVHQPTGGANIEISGRGLGLSNGMYMLRVANAKGSSTTKLLVGE
jgi:PKD repeat protein